MLVRRTDRPGYHTLASNGECRNMASSKFERGKCRNMASSKMSKSQSRRSCLENQLQYPLSTGASTRSSLPSRSRKSGQFRIRFTLLNGVPQEMGRFPQSLAMAINETFICLDQVFEPADRLEGDRVYGLIIKVLRLLIITLVNLGRRDQLG